MKTWYTKSGYKIIQVVRGRCNVFLLTNGKQNILIDSSRKKYHNQLLTNLKKLNIAYIDVLFLTHHHFDHTENAAFIREHFKAKVIINSAEAPYLATGDNSLPRGTLAPTRLLINLFGKKLQNLFRYEPCRVDIVTNERYELTELGFPNAYLLLTPGHSAGMTSLIVDNEIAIVGDAMIGTFPGSIFPPFADDITEAVKSWGKLLETGCNFFLPSHGTANSRQLVEKCFKQYTKSQ